MKKLGKVISVVATVVAYVACALCVALLLLTILGKRDVDGAVKILGYELRIVLSGSMENNPDVDVSDYEVQSIKTGSLVVVRLVPDDAEKAKEFYSRLKVGDVLTFRYNLTKKQNNAEFSPQVTISHRIVDITSNNLGGYIITLRGDNVSSSGNTDTQIIDTNVSGDNYVIGKVTGSSYALGRVISWARSPLGLALLVIVPCVVIIICQVVKIARLITNKDKSMNRENL